MLPFSVTVSPYVYDLLDKSPFFTMSRDVNYAKLAARLSLLDIAIGPGPTAVPAPHVSGMSSAAPSGRRPLSPEEITFNKEVDTLTQRLRLLSNKIVEAGAISNMSKLDAKDAGERLCNRLESTVRVGGRKHRAAFGDEKQVSEQSKNFFAKWGEKKKSGTSSLAEHGELDEVRNDEKKEDIAMD